MNNSIAYRWVKQSVSAKRQPFYEASPGYHTLYASDNGSIVAFRYVDDTQPMPPHLEECTVYETTKLEARLEQK